MTQQTEELIREIFRSDMKTAENMSNLVNNHEAQEIGETTLSVAESLLERIEDEEREKYVYSTMYQLGNALESEQIMEFSKAQLQKWVQQNG